jgi:hypothetical protein
VLWIKNLSLHFAFIGGSSLRGWSITETSTLVPGSIFPEFGRTQYSFGAVVLTLKATGWAWGLDIVSAFLTRVVSGPVLKGYQWTFGGVL